MKKMKLLFVSVALMALTNLCLATVPPSADVQSASVVAAKSDLPTNSGIGTSEVLGLFAIAASIVVLVSRRTNAGIKTTYRALKKTFVARANREVNKLTATIAAT